MDRAGVKVDYDVENDILYIEFKKNGKVADTVEIGDDIFADVGENGEILGIEIWNASKNIIEQIATNRRNYRKTQKIKKGQNSPSISASFLIAREFSADLG